ncbi:hypothetical protein C0993_003519 [Termitomyces sp. T159_Od127]|nr:hypothetical protein C0993_003519 [Termitomyces sp. T159_Od127]
MPLNLVAKHLAGFFRIRELFPSWIYSLLPGFVGKAFWLSQHWTVEDFSRPESTRIEPGELVEEENLPHYVAERYYPVCIGEVFVSRYRVIGKLGFGMTSTVWLARDLKEGRYVALKIYIRSSVLGFNELPEFAIYERLGLGPEDHPGRRAIRPLFDSFTITGPDGEHHCLVHPPLWGSLKHWLKINPLRRLVPPVLAMVLQQLFLALDYAKECEVIHTDISPSNIMLRIEDVTVLEEFEQAELEHPTPRKEINGRFIYQSRPIELPGKNLDGLGLPVLCDFGSAVWGGKKHDTVMQPDIYRSPEVILGVPWTYEIDIWNVGCVIWDLFEEVHLFHGFDEEYNYEYRYRAHLSEMISLLGLPPTKLIERGSRSSKFFSPDGKYTCCSCFQLVLKSTPGQFIAGIEVPPPMPWTKLETTLKVWEGEGEDRDLFLCFMKKMLQWDPQDRPTAKQLLEDEWLTARLANPEGRAAQLEGTDEDLEA